MEANYDLIGFIVVLIVVIILLWTSKSKRVMLNSNYKHDYGINDAVFHVEKAESMFSSNGKPICRYTLEVRFFSGKNLSDYHRKQYVLYGDFDKFRVGDELVLSKNEEI